MALGRAVSREARQHVWVGHSCPTVLTLRLVSLLPLLLGLPRGLLLPLPLEYIPQDQPQERRTRVSDPHEQPQPQSVGQECPPHTGIAYTEFIYVWGFTQDFLP